VVDDDLRRGEFEISTMNERAKGVNKGVRSTEFI